MNCLATVKDPTNNIAAHHSQRNHTVDCENSKCLGFETNDFNGITIY